MTENQPSHTGTVEDRPSREALLSTPFTLAVPYCILDYHNSQPNHGAQGRKNASILVAGVYDFI